jgi:ferredoxin
MNPKVDAGLCIGCGNCEETCPEVFRLESDGLAHVIVESPSADLYACVRDAEASCPVDAISIEE